MRTLLITGSLALLIGTSAAHAGGEYDQSIRGCEAAIADRLGMETADLRARLKGVDSAPRYRDLEFSVSALDAANPAQGVKVSCRARKNGEVLDVAFDESTLPDAVALH